MKTLRHVAPVALALASWSAATGCSSKDPAPVLQDDASTPSVVSDRDPGPNGPDPGPNAIWVTASGEQTALNGFAFPPTAGAGEVLVDGWELHFERVLVTIGEVELHENPDLVPTDPSQTGPVVARRSGPWIVDLHQRGPLTGEGSGTSESPQPITAFTGQNLRGNAPFARDMRYGVSFRSVPATADATRVQLDAADADVQEMVAKGWTTLLVGEAWFRGTSCTSSDPSYDFSSIPGHVRLRIGLTAPARWINCQNERLAPAQGIGNEEYPRGVQVNPNRSTIAQLTFHLDHPFKVAFHEGVPLRFDAFAARKAAVMAASETGPQGDGATTDVPVVTEQDLIGVEIDRLTDGLGRRLPWRNCVSLEDSEQPSGSLAGYATDGVPIDPSRPSSEVLRDLHDYVRYLVSWQGHLNGQGLCFTKRDYPSP